MNFSGVWWRPKLSEHLLVIRVVHFYIGEYCNVILIIILISSYVCNVSINGSQK